MKCPRCRSTQFSKNGYRREKQCYLCKACGRQFIEFYSSRGYSEDAKQICLTMYQKGMGLRTIERITGISHNTVGNWVRQAGLMIDQSSDVNELNEDSDI